MRAVHGWPKRFRDRAEAGRELARLLDSYRGEKDAIVLALPRGGVPVGYEIARALGLPLDVFVVRKLGVPGHSELAMGAIASGGVTVFNDELVELLAISKRQIDTVVRAEQAELARREAAYRGHAPPLDVRDKTVIVVDDGLATGASMKAAVRALKERAPRRVIVAVPVGARESCKELERTADAVVCARMPEPFQAVGLWYEDFEQTTDEEVRELMAAAREKPAA